MGTRSGGAISPAELHDDEGRDGFSAPLAFCRVSDPTHKAGRVARRVTDPTRETLPTAISCGDGQWIVALILLGPPPRGDREVAWEIQVTARAGCPRQYRETTLGLST